MVKAKPTATIEPTTETNSPAFLPFADDSAAQTIGGLTLENGTRRISLHGSLDLTRDRAGLERARALQAAVAAIVTALAGEVLPEAVADETKAPGTVRNPFA